MKKIVLQITTLVLTFLIFNYLVLMPINIRYSEFMVVLLVFIIGVKVILKVNLKSTSVEQIMNDTKSVIFMTSFIILIPILYGILSSPILFSSDYQKLIGPVNEQEFTSDFAAINTEKLPLIDSSLAILLGDKKIGTERGLGSEFKVGKFSDITFNDQLLAVAPLEFNDFFKWLSNKSTPGYVTVNKVTGEVNLVTSINDRDIELKYLSSAYFGLDLKRHTYFNGNYNDALANYYFEIDDEGTPYFVIPKTHKTVGIAGGDDVYEVITVNAENGEVINYKVEDAPKWVDNIYPKELVMKQLNDWGYYVNGFWNTVFSEKDIIVTTTGSRRVSNDGLLWHYTGMTSAGSDEATVGFVFTNARTKETVFYSESGATEEAAMRSAEGKVQNLGYYATFPLPININKEPTFFITLKDSKGLIKQYAFVNITDYSIVGNGETIADAKKSYLKQLNVDNNFNESDEPITINGTIERINILTNDGSEQGYIKLVNDKNIYSIISDIKTIALTNNGDKVSFTTIDNTISNFVNNTLNFYNDKQYVGQIMDKYRVYDTSLVCLEMLELIYKDDEYSYSLSCNKSKEIILVDNKNNEVNILEALKNDLVSIEDLMATNLVIYKMEKGE